MTREPSTPLVARGPELFDEGWDRVEESDVTLHHPDVVAELDAHLEPLLGSARSASAVWERGVRRIEAAATARDCRP